jgi:hypothetical protein
MWTSVGRDGWRSAGELTSPRSIDWAREVRKSHLRRAVTRVLSSVVGPVIRCVYCGQRGAVLKFDQDETQWGWRCRCCRHSRSGRVS